jgi:hypothetical protein
MRHRPHVKHMRRTFSRPPARMCFSNVRWVHSCLVWLDPLVKMHGFVRSGLAFNITHASRPANFKRYAISVSYRVRKCHLGHHGCRIETSRTERSDWYA